jgi:gamma-glutamylcyclotransferase (GGCT)/AIG2-like uncharacterized protein YtfP
MTDRDCKHLFVYGTLRTAFQNRFARRLSEEAVLLGQGRIRGRLYDLGEYPGARLSAEGDEWVIGEVFVLADAFFLPELDAYEGCGRNDTPPHQFTRVQSTTVMEDGSNVCAWLYEYKGATAEDRHIASGDYLKRT